MKKEKIILIAADTIASNNKTNVFSHTLENIFAEQDIVCRTVSNSKELHVLLSETENSGKLSDEASTPSIKSHTTPIIISGLLQEPPREDERLIQDIIRIAAEKNIPVLGICYGAQIIAKTYYPDIVLYDDAGMEVGLISVDICEQNNLLHVSDDAIYSSLHFHRIQYSKQYDKLIPIATNTIGSNMIFEAFRVRDTKIFGVQFHPEVDSLLLADILREYTEVDDDAIEMIRQRCDTAHYEVLYSFLQEICNIQL